MATAAGAATIVLSDERLRGKHVGAELADEFHRLLGVIVVPAGGLLVLTDDVTAEVIDDVEPAVLVVGGVHGRAVELAVARFGDGLARGIVVVPGPGLVRVRNAALVKDGLVVQQRDGVVILRHGVLLALVAVQLADALIIVLHLDNVGLFDVLGQVQQHVVLHVHLRGVGVHPEDVRQGAAGCAGLQQRPVLVPGDDLDVHVDAGLLGPQVGDGLQARELHIIPDLDFQHLNARAGKRKHEAQQANDRGSFLHNDPPLVSSQVFFAWQRLS